MNKINRVDNRIETEKPNSKKLTLNRFFSLIKNNLKKSIIIGIAAVLAIVILIVSVSVLVNGKMKFKSSEEMHEYMHGVWEVSLQGEYLIFDDNNIYFLNEYYLDNHFEPMFLEAKKNSEEALQNLKFDNCLKDKSLEEIADKVTNAQIIPQDGIIKINPDSKHGEIIRIKKDGVEYCEDASDGEYRTFTRVHDKADLNFDSIEEYFEESKSSYKPSAKKFIPTPKEYIEKLRNEIPALNSLQLAYDDDDFVLYSNNGKTQNYTDYMKYDKTTGSCTIALDPSRFLIVFEDGTLSIADKTSRSLSELLQYVEVLIGDYPLALTAEEMVEKYNEEATVLSGSKLMNTTVDGIGYTIQISTTGATKFIKITY